MSKFRLPVALLLVAITPLSQADPCPSLYIEPKNVERHAKWIVEGRIIEIRKTGTFRNCERNPMAPGGLHCMEIDKPEILSLEDITVVQDEGGRFLQANRSEITRASHCFSGALAQFMNAKPELKLLGKKVRFFGSEFASPPFVQPGYFWIEPRE